MAASNNFIVPDTPHVGFTKIATTSAVVPSNGAITGSGIELAYCCFASGADGSFIQRVRFNTVASAAAVNSVATTLRIFLSTVSTAEGSAAGATTTANTQLLAEISVPLISTASTTNATNYYDVPLNLAVPTGRYILVTQHLAQTTNQQWQATCIGGDY